MAIAIEAERGLAVAQPSVEVVDGAGVAAVRVADVERGRAPISKRGLVVAVDIPFEVGRIAPRMIPVLHRGVARVAVGVRRLPSRPPGITSPPVDFFPLLTLADRHEFRRLRHPSFGANPCGNSTLQALGRDVGYIGCQQADRHRVRFEVSRRRRTVAQAKVRDQQLDPRRHVLRLQARRGRCGGGQGQGRA